LSVKGRIARLRQLRRKWFRVAARARRRGAKKTRRKALRRAHQKLLAIRESRRLAKVARRLDGRGAAVKWAVAQVGTIERGYNRGPKISDWIRASGGRDGWPWCQYFANAVLRHGGGPQLLSGYTVAVVQFARQGLYGLKTVSRDRPKPGDFVYFKFPGVSRDLADHVGVYIGGGKTVEGNTSPGVGGSQNNGGGVFIRKRPWSTVAAVVRPTYRR
jgi:hypothetical protein